MWTHRGWSTDCVLHGTHNSAARPVFETRYLLEITGLHSKATGDRNKSNRFADFYEHCCPHWTNYGGKWRQGMRCGPRVSDALGKACALAQGATSPALVTCPVWLAMSRVLSSLISFSDVGPWWPVCLLEIRSTIVIHKQTVQTVYLVCSVRSWGLNALYEKSLNGFPSVTLSYLLYMQFKNTLYFKSSRWTTMNPD